MRIRRLVVDQIERDAVFEPGFAAGEHQHEAAHVVDGLSHAELEARVGLPIRG